MSIVGIVDMFVKKKKLPILPYTYICRLPWSIHYIGGLRSVQEVHEVRTLN